MAEDQIYKLTGLDKLKRAAMSRYFGYLSESERLEAFKLAFDLAKQSLEKADENIRATPDYFYAMVCWGLWKMHWIRHDLSRKNPEITGKQAREITERRIESLFSQRKDRVKRGKLKTLLEVRLFHVVQELRSRGVSWRECSSYLSTYHKTHISHVHLFRIYLKITSEKKLRGEL